MSRPLIVVFQLWESHHVLFEGTNQHLIHALSEKGQLHRARTASEARRFLSSTARPQAVLVADAAIISPEYYDILLHLVQYVKDGGTVVFGGIFSSFVRAPDLDAMFTNAWGLTWRQSDYTREDFVVNPRAKGLNISTLVKRYSMKAVFVRGVTLDETIYLEVSLSKAMAKGKGAAKFPTTSHKTPAAFATVGNGHVGYIGDVNAETGTTSLVLAMCIHPGSHSPISPGTGEPSGLPQNLSDNKNQPLPKHIVDLPPRRNILILSLEKEDWLDETYSTLFHALRQNANSTEVYAPFSALQVLSFNPRPDAVLVSDAAITNSEHQNVLTGLIDYARAGGTVVLAVQFSNNLLIKEARAFFSKWGVPWDIGSYHRTTFSINPSGIPQPLSQQALLPSYSMNAVHIKNAPHESAVYLPTTESHIESYAFAPRPITGDKALESPVVFARLGDGFLGYVGDVNGEQGSTRIVFEMCRVKIKPGDIGPRTFSSGLKFQPDGSTDPIMDIEPEIPLPSPSPPPRAPRPRETEVIARADRLAKTRSEKTKQAEILKSEGNELFRAEQWVEAAEKYRAAAFIAGPRPVYLSNLAAALLKVKLWVLAESAASRALLHDPKHGKSLYRRALARKEQERYLAADTDLSVLLRYDKTNAAALPERMNVRALKATKPSRDWLVDKEEMVRRGKVDDTPLDVEDESDSEDSSHVGNGTPCKFYNHDGCPEGKRCRFGHASDSKSVRDELGRNVCIYWLLGECRFGDHCVYAHDGTYLPQRGWWTDTTRLGHLREEFKDAVKAAPLSLPGGQSESILAEALRPGPWRKDLWAQAAYGAEVARMREEEEFDAEELRRWEEGNFMHRDYYGDEDYSEDDQSDD